MSDVRPRLGVFLNGVPEVENLFPIIRLLHQRGRIAPQLFVTSGLWRREARVRELLRMSGVPSLVRPNRLMKARPYYSRLLCHVDRMLVIADPKTDVSAYGPRSRYMMDMGIPSIWVQHGVTQYLVTYTDTPPVDFYSDPVFYWEDPAIHAAPLAPGLAERIRVVGFTKQPVMPIKAPPRALVDRLASYRKRVLICHTFRGGAHDADQIDRTYGLIRDYCLSNPDVGVIVRPHRGKVRANYNDQDRKLARACPNVFFSFQHKGMLRGLNMLDVLSLVDCVVSTPSTAILDGLFQGKPAALIASDCPQLASLPTITDHTSLEAFVEGGMTQAMRNLVSHYGQVDRNLARVCDEIELSMGVG